MIGQKRGTIDKGAAIAAAALVGLLISPAGPLSASPYAGWGKVYVTGGTVVLGLPANVGSHDDGDNNGEVSGGGGPLQRSSSLSYNLDDLAHNIAGYATGSSLVTVNPATGQLAGRSRAYNTGCGPSEYIVRFQGRDLHIPWGIYFGESHSIGYFSTVFYVAQGSSGLASGAPVDVILRTWLDGVFDSSPDGSYSHVYAGTRLADITTVPEFPPAAQQGWAAWTDIESRLHGDGYYMGHGTLLKHLDYDVPEDPQNPAVSYDSGEIVLQAHVGDWLFLESYYRSDVRLPAHGGTCGDYFGEADFRNTMSAGLIAGPNSPGIVIEAREFPVKLTVRIEGSGSVTRTPDAASYPAGETVVLSATPETGWGFDGWSGDATGEATPLTVTLNSSMTLTAHFLKFGDADGSGEVTMADAVAVLQTVAGFSPSPAVHRGADVNGDGRIGLAEALYILQTAAALR
jgi:uncharacterized repeat protein (TIGR02543 family)